MNGGLRPRPIDILYNKTACIIRITLMAFQRVMSVTVVKSDIFKSKRGTRFPKFLIPIS